MSRLGPDKQPVLCRRGGERTQHSSRSAGSQDAVNSVRHDRGTMPLVGTSTQTGEGERRGQTHPRPPDSRSAAGASPE